MTISFYDFLKDQGSAISGGLALVAGIIAYAAGRIQANATRTAAHEQIEAIRSQMQQQIDAATDQDARKRRDLLRSLSMECSRLKMVAERQIGVAERRYPRNTLIQFGDVAIFSIDISHSVREAAELSTLLPHSVVMGWTAVIAAGEQINALLKVNAPAADLIAAELIDTVSMLIQRASDLEGLLAEVPDGNW